MSEVWIRPARATDEPAVQAICAQPRAQWVTSYRTHRLRPRQPSLHSRVVGYGANQRAACLLRRVLSVPRLLNCVFRQLRRDEELALLIGYIIIGHKSPRLALRPTTLLRLLT